MVEEVGFGFDKEVFLILIFEGGVAIFDKFLILIKVWSTESKKVV